MSRIFLLIFVILPVFTYSQGNTDETAYKLIGNYSFDGEIITIYAVYKNTDFVLKICNIDTCHTTFQEFDVNITPRLLASSVEKFIETKFKNSADITLDQQEKDAFEQLQYKIKINRLDSKNKELIETIGDIDSGKEHYSAKIILNKKAPFKLKDTSKWKAFKSKYGSESFIYIEDARIQFFNNRANSIYIKAYLKNIGTQEPKKLIFLNNNFSVPIRYFNSYGSTVEVQIDEEFTIKIDYNDVFDYEADQFFNYSIANSEISLSNGISEENSKKVAQRRFLDFFTAIIYSDLLGLDTDNSNALLNAKAKLLVPLTLWNKGKFTPTRQFATEINFALSNNFKNESRYISLNDDGTTTSPSSVSSFDLLKMNNIYAKINLDLLTYESKGWFLNTSLGYDVGFLRTGLKYTKFETQKEDEVINKQLLSIMHGPYINFEIRPQINFGADVTMSLNAINNNGEQTIGYNNTELPIQYSENTYNILNVEANFYWLTSPNSNTSKGGIYVKLGSYYHLEDKTLFPQLMVGYATNLTSFINTAKNNRKEAITSQ